MQPQLLHRQAKDGGGKYGKYGKFGDDLYMSERLRDVGSAQAAGKRPRRKSDVSTR